MKKSELRQMIREAIKEELAGRNILTEASDKDAAKSTRLTDSDFKKALVRAFLAEGGKEAKTISEEVWRLHLISSSSSTTLSELAVLLGSTIYIHPDLLTPERIDDAKKAVVCALRQKGRDLIDLSNKYLTKDSH